MRLNNIHRNQTIFILGCGPSHTKEVANKLFDADVITIGVNCIFNLIRPRYHFHADFKAPSEYKRQFSWVYRQELLEMSKMGTTLFCPLTEQLKMTTDLAGKHFLEDRKIKFQDTYLNLADKLRLGPGSTSIFHAIQLAVIMGAKRIVLVGVDFYIEYSDKKNKIGKLHSYDEDGIINKKTVDKLADVLRYFEHDLKKKAKPILERKGIEVVNTSKDSKLKAFRKVTLDSELSKVRR